jgi:SsrA-binding protein
MALVTNKKASFNYELGDKMTAGIELFGYEVKSLRKGEGSLDGSYIIVRGGEAFLIGSYIPAFQKANAPKDYNDRRNRVLLLRKKEIAELAVAEQKKTALIPLAFFAAGSKIKLEFAFATGKNKGDKRHSIKKRDTERDLRRKL